VHTPYDIPTHSTVLAKKALTVLAKKAKQTVALTAVTAPHRSWVFMSIAKRRSFVLLTQTIRSNLEAINVLIKKCFLWSSQFIGAHQQGYYLSALFQISLQ
jgi:hypothetical protein